MTPPKGGAERKRPPFVAGGKVTKDIASAGPTFRKTASSISSISNATVDNKRCLLDPTS